MAPEAREAIFNRFHSIRLDEEFGRHSGLGLAIAKAIVEGMAAVSRSKTGTTGAPGRASSSAFRERG